MYKKELAILLILALAALGGCGDKADIQSETLQMSHEDADGHDHDAAPAATGGLTGTILETMDSGGYTYVRVKTDSGEIWAAGPLTAVATGQTVVMSGQMLMRGFHSKTLAKDFDEIWFVSALQTPDQAAAAKPAGMPATLGASGGQPVMPNPNSLVAPVAGDFSGVKKPAGGMTIAEIYAARGSLAGKSVTLRAKVVKFTPNVMSRNWIHVQDGTRNGDDFDLTVTSDGSANVDDVLLIKGTVATDKDFGAGYVYKLIVEGAEISTK